MSRTTIDSSKRTTSYSKRADKGKLDVIRKDCPHDGHHKAFSCNGRITCTKCKRRIQ